ncbi:hypothetical protein NPIL_429741 [Nephila pilipes]|uniref:Uncharacterized protein n=1 Tax=Nephila pilipes TaxID=299642 RepID=A0A8X6MQA2_NEPPI|nr:hypothetical protein NPIL_429741 [Nephila pilipes]
MMSSSTAFNGSVPNSFLSSGFGKLEEFRRYIVRLLIQAEICPHLANGKMIVGQDFIENQVRWVWTPNDSTKLPSGSWS